MTTAPLLKVRSVEARPGYRLAVYPDRGRAFVVDLSDIISEGGVFTLLLDHAKFAAVRVGENARVVEWPEPKDDHGYPIIEIDVESLQRRVEVQRDSMLADVARRALELTKRPRRTSPT